VPTINLTIEEMLLLEEALDSHEYWQLSDTDARNDGYSLVEDGDDEEIDACRKLAEKLSSARHMHHACRA
jgi:hypothetical protein